MNSAQDKASIDGIGDRTNNRMAFSISLTAINGKALAYGEHFATDLAVKLVLFKRRALP